MIEFKIAQICESYNITRLLDIGANVGDFAESIKNISNNKIEILSIEANPYCEPFLKEKNLNYKIQALSNLEIELDLFLSNISDVCTGTSYYQEMVGTGYNKNRKIKVKTNTLDNIIDETFEFIKIDTQGSELDIIKGGVNTIKKSKFLLLEVSIIPYNKDAPSYKELDEFVTSLGFHKADTLNNLIRDEIHQEDWLYVNGNLK
jgi:FkbM family methyltransferase